MTGSWIYIATHKYGDDIMKKLYEQYKWLHFWDAFWENEAVGWVVDRNDAALFRIDIKANIAKRVCELPRGGAYSRDLYTYLNVMEDKVVILPQNCMTVVFYDRKKERIDTIKMPCDEFNSGYGTIASFFVGNQLCVFSSHPGNSAYVVDMGDYSVREMPGWRKMLHNLGIIKSENYTALISIYKNGFIFGAYESNEIIYYDFKSNEYKVVYQLPPEIRVYRIYTWNESLWILPKDGNVIYYLDLEDDLELKEVKLPIEGISFFSLLIDEEDVVAISDRVEKIYIYKRKNKDVICVDCSLLEKKVCFKRGRLEEQYIYLYPFETDELICINRKNYECNSKRIDLSSGRNALEIFNDMYSGFKKATVLREEEMGLGMLIELLNLQHV